MTVLQENKMELLKHPRYNFTFPKLPQTTCLRDKGRSQQGQLRSTEMEHHSSKIITTQLLIRSSVPQRPRRVPPQKPGVLRLGEPDGPREGRARSDEAAPPPHGPRAGPAARPRARCPFPGAQAADGPAGTYGLLVRGWYRPLRHTRGAYSSAPGNATGGW